MSSFSTCCVVVLYHAASFFTCCVVVLHAMSWLSTLCRRPLFCRCLSLLCHRPHCCVIVLIAVSSSSLLCHRALFCGHYDFCSASLSLLHHCPGFWRKDLNPTSSSVLRHAGSVFPFSFVTPVFPSSFVTPVFPSSFVAPVFPSSFATPDQSSCPPSSRRISLPVLLRHAGSVFPSSFILPFCQEDSVVCASHWRPSAIKLRFSALMMMMK